MQVASQCLQLSPCASSTSFTFSADRSRACLRSCRPKLPSFTNSHRYGSRSSPAPSRSQPKQRTAVYAEASELTTEAVPEPEDARGAIAVGLKLYNAGNYEQALGVFTKALDLPGTGLKRFRDKPPAISDGEKIATLYNIACCHSRLGALPEALQALVACLKMGYGDYQQIRTDPDLEALRQDPQFEALLSRFDKGRSGGFFGGLLKGFTS